MIDLWEELHTDRLLLRKINFEDIDFIFNHFKDEEICEYMVDNEPIKTIDEAREIIEWSHSIENNPNNNRWLILLRNSNTPIGTIGFHKWDKNNNIAEIGYDLNKSYWKQGLMSEAIRSALKFGFEKMELNRVQAFVHIENIPSYNVLKKNGFYSEGIVRDMYLYRGRYHDHYAMALLLKEKLDLKS